jgi:chromosome segregation ATPase
LERVKGELACTYKPDYTITKEELLASQDKDLRGQLAASQQQVKELELDVTDLSNERRDQERAYYDRQLALEASQQQLKALQESYGKARKHEDELEQQNRKLREALEDMLFLYDEDDLFNDKIADEARAALSVSPKPTSGTCQRGQPAQDTASEG